MNPSDQAPKTDRHPGFACFCPTGEKPYFENEFGYGPREYFLGTHNGMDLWIYQEHEPSIGVVSSETPGDYQTFPIAHVISAMLHGPAEYAQKAAAYEAVKRARRHFDIVVKSFLLSNDPEDL